MGFDLDKNDCVKTVLVKYDNPKVGRKAAKEARTGDLCLIKKQEVKFCVGRNRASEVTRSQFPLLLAWASTIHKVQGFTVSEIVISFQGHYVCGQAYVALQSRVRQLEGLYLRYFDSKKITCSAKVQRYMNVLRLKRDSANGVETSVNVLSQRASQAPRCTSEIMQTCSAENSTDANCRNVSDCNTVSETTLTTILKDIITPCHSLSLIFNTNSTDSCMQ